MAGLHGAGEANIFDAQPRLTRNQYLVVGATALGSMLELLDTYIIGFVLAFIIGPWGLKASEAAVVLLASGLGALVGSFVWGHLADRIGRRTTFAATILLTSLGSILLAATPEGNWVVLSALRFVVGIGVGAFFVPMMLVQEFLPARHRGRACSIVSAAAAAGLLLGALCASYLAPVFGWRGMFLAGGLPILLAVAIQLLIPESPYWLAARGRSAEVQAALRWALPPGTPLPPLQPPRAKPGVPARELLRYPRTLCVSILINFGCVTGYYGMTMWSPTLIAQVQGLPGAKAAGLMIGISAAGLVARILVGVISDRYGRRRCGAVAAPLCALALVAAGLVGRGDLFHPSDFWLVLALAFVFADSCLALLAAYTAEIWPISIRGRGCGIAYGASGLGKILGPVGFALLIGSSNVLKPMATAETILGSFSFLAAMFVLAGLGYWLARPETDLRG